MTSSVFSAAVDRSTGSRVLREAFLCRYRDMARFSSNQALELTATRCGIPFSMTKSFDSYFTLGFGSRSSAWSR
jgi:hypothetical protein